MKATDPNVDRQLQRQIRVFVSSTFWDMHAEREELVKRVFPRLRHVCEARGVTWGEVDLRWGIPKEANADGRVLPLCLAEIDHCRPYFIGILGDRYGWIPDLIPSEVLEAHPWLRDFHDHSVTALEIFYGVLRNPEMAAHAYFYFRNPMCVGAEPEESADRVHKLAGLKDQIRNSGRPVRGPYRTAEELGELVFNDMKMLIDGLYPEQDIPDPLEREYLGHEAFAAHRARIYIGGSTYLHKLDAHARGNGLPLVILGESGSGKSALLANWAHAWRKQQPGSPVLTHFIGSTPDSVNWATMLRRILGELKKMFDLPMEIPDEPGTLRVTFVNTLHAIAGRSRLVLALDGLDQLEDREGAPDLVWLPPVIPSNVRLIVSTLPGRSLDNLSSRFWPTLNVQPLCVDERRQLIGVYLAQYSKKLDSHHLERIAAADQARNPLYLCTLLSELRQFGKHDDIGHRIEWYLQASDPISLYGRVIVRLEQDYEDRSGLDEDLVGNTLSIIWAARRGVSEIELLDLLGADGEPLPQAVWTPLFLALQDSFVNRGGLLTFFHAYFRQAVKDAYLPTPEHEVRTHLELANYFEKQVIGPRQLTELPWQLAKAADWKHLADLLGQPDFFSASWENNEYDLKAYWTQIHENAPEHLAKIVHPLFQNLAINFYSALEQLWRLTFLLQATGHLDAAMALRKLFAKACRDSGDMRRFAMFLDSQAVILKERGQLDEAVALHDEEERICRDLGDDAGLSRSLGNHAIVLLVRGDFDAANALLKQQEDICRRLGDMNGLQASLCNQSVILKFRGDLNQALVLLKEQERICREMGNMDNLSRSLGNQALIVKALGDIDTAMALHEYEEEISRSIGSKEGIARSLCNRALILQSRGELDGAMELLQQSEEIYDELGNKEGLQASFGNQGTILAAQGDISGAIDQFKKQESICRELGSNNPLTISLINQAIMLRRNRTSHAEACRLADDALRLASTHGYVALARQCRSIRDSILL